MSRRIEDIEPENLEEYLTKYKYALGLMDMAVQAGVAISRLKSAVPRHLDEQHKKTDYEFEKLIQGLREYREEQYEAILASAEKA